MIRIALEDEGRVAVRIVVSPLLHVVHSLLLARKDLARLQDRHWRSLLARHAAELDGRLFDALSGDWLLPDFMAPLPVPPGRPFAEELELLAATPPEQVVADVHALYPHGAPAPFAPYLDDPADALAGYVAGLERFWEAAIAPMWPRITSLLQREVLIRSQASTTVGLAAAVERLHSRVGYEPGAIVLDVTAEEEHELGDRRVTICPLAVGEGRILWNLAPADQVVIAYQASGALTLWDTGRLPVDERLAAVVGEPRARILGALASPWTQRDLTRILGQSNGTVSPHLQTLHAAGLLVRSRVGRSVYYELSEAGRDLVATVGGAD